MRVEDLVRDYLLLALRLDRLVPGAVDAFTGDPALRVRVGREPRPSAASLVRAAGRLADAVPDAGLEAPRAAFLSAQLRACEWVARRCAGQLVSFRAELAAVFDVTVDAGKEDGCRAAHRVLDAALPGRGGLGGRVLAHRRADEVPRERLAAGLAVLSEALRDRARKAGLLPDLPESVGYRIVDDAPWSALQSWHGGGRSHVTVNAGARPRRAQLAQLVAHEAYPGHHTEHCRRAAGPVARGWDEHHVVLVWSPQSVLAEGAAERGLQVLVGPGCARWASQVLAEVGLDFDAEVAEEVERATALLARVRLDAAVLLHERRAGPDAVLAHLRRWLLVDDRRARQILRFLADPRWRGYPATYVEGSALVGSWLGEGAAVGRFRRLLDEVWTPSTLRADLVTQRRPNGQAEPTGGGRTTMSGRPFC